MKNLQINPQRLMQRIRDLAQIGKGKNGGINRIAFSEADLAGRKYVIKLMESAGLKTRIDEAGNILGRRRGSDDTLPVIMFGSHTDTVPQGGKYDGALGVLGIMVIGFVLHNALSSKVAP